MSLEFQAIIRSETVYSNTLQLYTKNKDLIGNTLEVIVGNPIEPHPQFDQIPYYSNPNDIGNLIRPLGTVLISTQRGKILLSTILKGEFNELKRILMISHEEFYIKALLQIKVKDIKASQIIEYGPVSKSKKRVRDYISSLSHVSYKKPLNIFKSYSVNEYIRNIPFNNYDNNIPLDGKNCFLNFIESRYPRISKNSMIKYKNGANIDDIISFTDKYKIKTTIYNIAGRLIHYRHDHEKDNNHSAFVCIIGNKHIYPIKNSNSIHAPTFSTEVIEKRDTTNENTATKDTFYITNDTFRFSDGYFKNNELDAEEIDKVIFDKLKPNFSFESDVKSIKPLLYCDKTNISKVICEYDLINAYYKMAYEEIDNDLEYPIFTCMDLWEIFNKDNMPELGDAQLETDIVNNSCYFSISNEALIKISVYGFTENIRTGFMINCLIKTKILTLDDIEYIKIPSYTGTWIQFKLKIDGLIDNKVKKELDILDVQNISAEDKKKIIEKTKLKKKFSVYNGMLGKLRNCKEEFIMNADDDDYDLLNYECDEELWAKTDMKGCFKKNTKANFRHLNNVTIYNTIVETTNLIMFRNILFIQRNTPDHILPSKIKTDAMAYPREVHINPKYQEYYKLVTRNKNNKNLDKLTVKLLINDDDIYKSSFNVHQEYYNIPDILKNIKDNELDGMYKNNISYYGAPGTGKTWEVLNKLDYDLSTTTTNMCCLNMQDPRKLDDNNMKIIPKTLFSTLQLFDCNRWSDALRSISNKTLWVDEFSMISRFMWNFLTIACMKYNTKLILTGDINQIPPIKEDRIDMNNMVFNSLMGLKTHTTNNQRNDNELVVLRDRVLNEQNTKWLLYNLFKSLDSQDDFTKYDRHIAFTNKMCMYVNKKILDKRKYTFEIKKDNEGSFISMDASVGVLLQCRITNRDKGIYRRDVWKIINKCKDGYQLMNLLDNKIRRKFEMHEMNFFSLGFCVTSHSSQGLTIIDDLCIHQTKKMLNCDSSILYTAITRAKQFKKLHLFYEEPNGVHNINEKWQGLTDIAGEDDELYTMGQQVKVFKK